MPLEKLTGDTINLSEYLDLGFYDPVLYWDTLSGEKGEDLPVIWLNISHRVGAGMCYWIFNKQGNVLARYTVQHFTKEDLLNPTLKDINELSLDRRALCEGQDAHQDYGIMV